MKCQIALFACHAATENLESLGLMADFKNWTLTKPIQLYIVRRDSTKFMLTVPDTLTSCEIMYLQVYCQNLCLMFDLLLFL